MAVVQTKSQGITAQDAFTSVNSNIQQGNGRTDIGVAPIANGDSIASVIRLVRLQSNARITDAWLFNTAVTGAAGDVGLYRTAADGGAVVDADFFTAAASIASASAGTNVIGGNVLSPANREKRLWEALGLTADPVTYYDVAVTLTAAATAAGTVGIELKWAI